MLIKHIKIFLRLKGEDDFNARAQAALRELGVAVDENK
jgi:hypothetical protein